MYGKPFALMVLDPLGTPFAIDIIGRACTSHGIKIMSFLKEEHVGSLTKHWSLVLEKGTPETLLLVSHWIRALVGTSKVSQPLDEILVAVGRNIGGDIA